VSAHALTAAACAQPTGIGPTVDAPSVDSSVDAPSVGVEAPRYSVLQVPMSPAEAAALEVKILRAINALRAAHGLRALTLSPRLRGIARARNKDMFKRGYFSHTDPEHRSPYARMRASDIRFSATGETISYPPVGGDIAQKVIADWLEHPGGKVQVLNPRFTQVGVGVFKSWGHYMFVTAIYLTPPYSPH
jgi:uncharacterized protein YkwD